MRLLSYSILYYILHFSVHKNFFTFITSEPLSVSYIIVIATLDKICEIYTFDRCPHGCTGQKSYLACGEKRKLENNLKGSGEDRS